VEKSIDVLPGLSIGMSFLWETSHGMAWDRHKLLWDGNGTDKYVPWTTLYTSTWSNYFWAILQTCDNSRSTSNKMMCKTTAQH